MLPSLAGRGAMGISPGSRSQRSVMSEEREFWGIWTPRGRGLLKWRLRAPGSKALPLYPVFSSKEKAEEFVKAAYAHGTGNSDIGSSALLDLLGNIRKLDPDEIP